MSLFGWFSRTGRAYRALTKKLSSEGFAVWPVDNKTLPYRVGVTLNWSPGLGNGQQAVYIESRKVAEISKWIANERGLELLVTTPNFSAGGVPAMYIGFKEKAI